MKVLILTPDTDIDRRIVLQANSIIKLGFEVSIIGVPYSGENFLSGSINSKIKVSRIDLKDIEYHSKLVGFYKKAHQKIMSFAYKRNDFLNSYANNNIKSVSSNDHVAKQTIKKTNNKIVNLIVKIVNFLSTISIRVAQNFVNYFYRMALFFVRLFKLNFFPIFDKAFYNAGIIEEANLIVANDLPSLKAAYLISKEKNIPLIYDAHENYTEQCTLPKRYAKLLERTEVDILPKVDFWIVPNELLGESMIKKYKEKYNVEIKEPLVIQNAVAKWIDYKEFIDCNLLKEKLNLSPEKKVVLFQGGFLAKRNLENLVKSMKYINNPNIVLVMLGFGQYGSVLQRIANKSKVTDKVKFMEAVSQDELLKYTCSADVGIIPYPAVDNNTYYCSPNKLYEFIQARLPILANNLPFLRKVIDGQGIGAVQDFSSPQLIGKAIEDFFADEEKLLKYKQNISELAEKIHWEAEEEKLLSQYTQYSLVNRTSSSV